MKAKYVSGSNIPGYMPDNDPCECETLHEAKACLIFDIENYIENIAQGLNCGLPKEDKEAIRESENFIQRIKLAEETLQEFKEAHPQICNVYIDDYVFWIAEQ